MEIILVVTHSPPFLKSMELDIRPTYFFLLIFLHFLVGIMRQSKLVFSIPPLVFYRREINQRSRWNPASLPSTALVQTPEQPWQRKDHLVQYRTDGGGGRVLSPS